MVATTQSLFDPSIELHKELRNRLQKDKESIEKRIADIDAVIERLESEVRRAARAGGKTTVARRPKGENAKIVALLFESNNGPVALSMKEIAEKASLSFSSVQRVLKERYVQGEDGLWRRKSQ